MTDKKPPCACACESHDPARRNMLTGVLGFALAPLGASAFAQTAGRSQKPEPGDRLAFMVGDKKDQEITPADLLVGAVPTLAYPLDPATGKVLVSRVNLLTVVKLKAEDIQPSSQKNAADGIVAFSAICTHYGCPITTLHPSQSQIVCNCHGSVFNAADRGVVTTGPATRRLAMLPLAIKDGALVVAGKFDGPLGPPT
ncbi:ubiquinol-cytochrome c reductase iron-sulfur subunit [Dokdonella koreensis]|uniref:Rieske (2Fe-2S) domain protein n=1 Tax=Dokdonella koreensis DS-123 TaxID=1300342 RepID=A0A160DRR9_9GAMM|nr:Rieske 2Fe-2S domain-containing protein [Dokdonella koreensis]ANB16919.1 Rieske (2Fe-2S) domain protein [Dokdonella koreensis DS-123]